MKTTTNRFLRRPLSRSVRLSVFVILTSIGIGCLVAQPARPIGKMERLLTGDPARALGSSSQMRTAFTKDSVDWKEVIEKLSKKKNISEDDARKLLVPEREGERLALLKWIQAGGPKKAFDDDSFTLPADWKKDQPITARFVRDGGKALKVASLIKARCVVCHNAPDGAADEYAFDKYERIKKYIPDPNAKPGRP